MRVVQMYMEGLMPAKRARCRKAHPLPKGGLEALPDLCDGEARWAGRRHQPLDLGQQVPVTQLGRHLCCLSRAVNGGKQLSLGLAVGVAVDDPASVVGQSENMLCLCRVVQQGGMFPQVAPWCFDIR